MSHIYTNLHFTHRETELKTERFFIKIPKGLHQLSIAHTVRETKLKLYAILLYLFCPLYGFPQTPEMDVVAAVNRHVSQDKPFCLTQKYYYNNGVNADTLAYVTTQYLHSSNYQGAGYEKFDYLIKSGSISYYRQEAQIFSYNDKTKTYAINSLYEDPAAIQNPHIYGISPGNEATVKLDSTREYYLLSISESSGVIPQQASGIRHVFHEYKIVKSNFFVIAYTKSVNEGQMQIYHRFEFEKEEMASKKFRKLLDDYFYKSDYLDIPTLQGQVPKKDKQLDTVPRFEVTTLDGKTIVDDTLQKLTLIDFWFIACRPCRQSMPYLQNLHSKYRDHGLLVLGINPIDQDTAEILKTLQKYGINYPVTTEGSNLIKQLNVDGFPTLILIDHRRKILFYESGFHDYKMKELETLIGKSLQ